jgi:hypothetical protein
MEICPRIDIASAKFELDEVNASTFQEFMCTTKNAEVMPLDIAVTSSLRQLGIDEARSVRL